VYKRQICQIAKSNRIESKLFLPSWNALSLTSESADAQSATAVYTVINANATNKRANWDERNKSSTRWILHLPCVSADLHVIFTCQRGTMPSPCVRLSVCLSVTSRCCIETTGRIELVLAWMLASCHCIVRKFGYLSEIRILPSGIMSQTLDLEISPQLDRVVNRAHRRTSLFITLTTVDAPSD